MLQFRSPSLNPYWPWPSEMFQGNVSTGAKQNAYESLPMYSQWSIKINTQKLSINLASVLNIDIGFNMWDGLAWKLGSECPSAVTCEIPYRITGELWRIIHLTCTTEYVCTKDGRLPSFSSIQLVLVHSKSFVCQARTMGRRPRPAVCYGLGQKCPD